MFDCLFLDERSLSSRSGLIPRSPPISNMLTGRATGERAACDLERLSELKGFFKSPVRVSAADLFRLNCGLLPAIKDKVIQFSAE